MRLLHLSRPVFAMFAVAAFLVGCGATPVTPTGAKMQGHAQSGSKEKTLLYISSAKKASVYVYNYPSGHQVATLVGFYGPAGLCSDGNGDVWVTDTDPYTGTGYLDEYAPGRKHPIATLDEAGNSPQGCSVDPITGDLAVANDQNNIAIYPNAQAPPAYYSTTGLVNKPKTIAYDDSGNVYFASSSGHAAWLPAGAPGAMKLGLRPSPRRHGPLRWDGQYLTVLESAGSHDDVWRYELRGKSAKLVDRIELDCCMGDYAIRGSILAATMPRLGEASVSRYPAGGKAFLGLTAIDPTGIAIATIPAQK